MLSPAPVPRPLLRDFLLGCGNRRNFVSVFASGHTEVRATTWVTNFSFSFRKLQRLRDSRAEERIPLEFALWRGQRAWALLCRLHLAALVRGFCFVGGDKEAPVGNEPEGCSAGPEPSPERPAAACAQDGLGRQKEMERERRKKLPRGDKRQLVRASCVPGRTERRPQGRGQENPGQAGNRDTTGLVTPLPCRLPAAPPLAGPGCWGCRAQRGELGKGKGQREELGELGKAWESPRARWAEGGCQGRPLVSQLQGDSFVPNTAAAGKHPLPEW